VKAREHGSVNSAGQQRSVDAPRPRPRAVPIVARAAMARMPQVEQDVAGTRIEASAPRRRRQIAYVRCRRY
jgi:hypothetical protein